MKINLLEPVLCRSRLFFALPEAKKIRMKVFVVGSRLLLGLLIKGPSGPCSLIKNGSHQWTTSLTSLFMFSISKGDRNKANMMRTKERSYQDDNKQRGSIRVLPRPWVIGIENRISAQNLSYGRTRTQCWWETLGKSSETQRRS